MSTDVSEYDPDLRLVLAKLDQVIHEHAEIRDDMRALTATLAAMLQRLKKR